MGLHQEGKVFERKALAQHSHKQAVSSSPSPSNPTMVGTGNFCPGAKTAAITTNHVNNPNIAFIVKKVIIVFILTGKKINLFYL
jgi:hypothetical protein